MDRIQYTYKIYIYVFDMKSKNKFCLNTKLQTHEIDYQSKFFKIDEAKMYIDQI